MRKVLHEIQVIDQYLHRQLSNPDRLVFEASMLVSPALEQQVRQQRKVYQLVRWFGRKAKKQQLNTLHARLMEDHQFRDSITALFP